MLERARQSGQLGASPKTLDPILEMTLACDRMAEELAPATVRHLEHAGVAAEDGATAQALAAARAVQQQIRTALEQLRAQLEEWNEFQDVIIQTRAVLDKQREVQVRTRDSMGDVPGAVPAEPSGGGEPPKERR
jgi:hypothetical protein